MQIIFDNIIFSLQKAGGISVVWYELLRRIINEKIVESRFIEFDNCNTNIFRKKLNIDADKIDKRSKQIVKLRRYFNPIIKSNEKFIFHSSYYRYSTNKNAINITTVHDFTYEKYFKGFAKWIHCWQKYKAINHSDFIVCVSENTKNDLIHFLPKINTDKIRIIHNGVSDEYLRLPENIDYHLHFPNESFILYVGARDTYKRFDLAIKVSKKFGFNLVIVGGGELNKTERSHLNQYLGIENYIQITKINNTVLNKYYNKAYCLMYTSEYEGFGIPLIEAQKAGCPVIAYNGSSITEIAGNSACLINELSLDEISEYITILQNKGRRKEIIKDGLFNAEKFSWDKTYQQYLNLYLEIQKNLN